MLSGSSSCSGSTDLHSRYCGGIFSTDTTATDYITICGQFDLLLSFSFSSWLSTKHLKFGFDGCAHKRRIHKSLVKYLEFQPVKTLGSIRRVKKLLTNGNLNQLPILELESEMGHLLESHLLEKTAQHQNLNCSTQLHKYMQLLKNQKKCHFEEMQVIDQNVQLLKQQLLDKNIEKCQLLKFKKLKVWNMYGSSVKKS